MSLFLLAPLILPASLGLPPARTIALAVNGHVIATRTSPQEWTSARDQFSGVLNGGARLGIGMTTTLFGEARVRAEPPNDRPYVGENFRDGVVLLGREAAVRRPVTKLPGTNRTYQAFLDGWLRQTYGQRYRPGNTRFFRVDLDGNGTDEVILEAASFEQPGTEVSRDEYSVVLLRGIRRNRVETHVLWADRFGRGQMPYRNRLEAIADIDGDGVMEVVVTSRYYEGEAGRLWRWRNGELKKLAESGDGV